MKAKLPDTLVRFNVHMRRDQVGRLVQLANQMTTMKRRDVRLGEALEVALVASLAWTDNDLMGLVVSDRAADHWLKIGPVNRRGGQVLLPSALTH
ncbi:hypothetical protein ACMGG8_25355 [Pseudomonas sp. BNK-45]|uniref:hypothetical protein n=1 Tax=Pseudomonas sp. BNK-45 TaxID=3376180 RepID=UPI0039BEE330